VSGARGVMIKGCHPPSKVVVFHDNHVGALLPVAIRSPGEVVFEGPAFECGKMSGLTVEAGLLDVSVADGIYEEVIGEGGDVMIVGGAVCIVRVTREGVGFVSGTCTVNKGNIVVPKCENISRDPSVDYLGAMEILKILVVSNNDHLVAGTHE